MQDKIRGQRRAGRRRMIEYTVNCLLFNIESILMQLKTKTSIDLQPNQVSLKLTVRYFWLIFIRIF